MKKHCLLFLLMLMTVVNMQAYDVAAINADGVTIYYNYINNNTELQVIDEREYNVPVFNIPSKVNGIPVTSIGKGVFSHNTTVTTINIGSCLKEIRSDALCYDNYNYCSSLREFIAPEDNPNFTSIDGVLYNKVKDSLVCYPFAKPDETWTTPSTMRTMSSLFNYVNAPLKEITFTGAMEIFYTPGYCAERTDNVKMIFKHGMTSANTRYNKGVSTCDYYVPKGTLSSFLIFIKKDTGSHIYEVEDDVVWSETNFSAPSDFTTYYDYDGDGVMEYYSCSSVKDGNNYNIHSYGFFDKNGVLKEKMDEKRISSSFSAPSIPYIAIKNGNGDLLPYWKYEYDTSLLSIGGDYNYILLADIDNDGRKDLVGKDFSNSKFTIDYQQLDGTFLTVEQSATLDAEAAANAANRQGGGGVVSFADGMMVKAPKRRASSSNRAVEFVGSGSSYETGACMGIDMNEDGVLDLLNCNSRVFYSYADNKYFISDKKRTLFPCDLNGDSELDYICYDGTNIILQVRTSGTEYNEKTLFTNSNVKQIIYKDFDHDGDIDILVYINTFSATYFVFFRNDGDLTFKKKERNFAANYELKYIKDIDADGLYEMYIFDHDNEIPKLMKISTDLSVNESDFDFSDRGSIYKYGNYYYPFAIGDFDNDGKMDYHYLVYSGVKFGNFSQAVNTAPKKMAAPTAVLNAETGRLRINWQLGEDTETSACDLTYELRIGTQPASGDVLFGASLADGRRRLLDDGNMGRSLNTLFNAKSMKPGTYYISVQAIDGGGRGGAWSDDFVYEHQLMDPVIVSNYTKQMSTADTLQLSVKAPVAGATYQWTLSEGELLKSEPKMVKRASSNTHTIAWTADDVAAAGTLDGKSFEKDGLKITLLDTNGKMAIDANNAYFGTAEAYQKYSYRLKSGGKSSNNLGITLTLPAAGTLKLYARTGSNSATDRTVTVTQNGTELINQIVKEDNAVPVAVGSSTINVHPAYTATVNAGTAEIGFPVGSMNFYAIELVAEEGGNNEGGEEGGNNEGGEEGGEGGGEDDLPAPEGSYAECIFHHDGTHTINLTMTIDGKTLYSEPLTINIDPAKYVNLGDIPGFVDINQDGYPEYLGKVNDGQGKLDEVLLSYVTNIPSGTANYMDYNMDGYPDAIVKNNVYINAGDQDNDFELETQTFDCQYHLNGSSDTYIDVNYTHIKSMWFDANNDGYLDNRHYFNNGTNIVWRPYYFADSKYKALNNDVEWVNGTPYYYIGYPNYDVNRDGMLDIVTLGSNNNGKRCWYVMYKDSTCNFNYTEPQLLFETDYVGWWEIDDVNNDGYMDIVFLPSIQEPTLAIAKGSASLPYTGVVTYELPVKFEKSGSLRDYNNDGYLDLLFEGDRSNYYSWRYYIFEFGPDFAGELVEAQPVGISDHCFMVQKDGGYPDGYDSHITNQPPSAPATVAAKQTKDGLLITWSDAQDDHTSAMQMRYNVSVKRKGKKGDNSFVISPMNGLKDAATICGTVMYKKSTQMLVPASVLTAGETYEIQVQAIDLWNQHSPMTQAVEFTMTSDGYIDMAEQVAVGKETTVKFVGTNASSYSLNVGADGIIVKDEGNGSYIVKWTSEGVKNITLTADTKTIQSTVTVVKPIDLTFAVPAQVFAGVPLTISVSDEMAVEPKDVGLRVLNNNKVVVDYVAGSKTAVVTFPTTGTYELEAFSTDAVEGSSYKETVNVTAMMPTAAIEQVDVEDGYYAVRWNTEALPAGIGKVMICKEGSSTGEFREIEAVSASAGYCVDKSSNPAVQASRYRIQLLADNGQTSEMSDVHKPLHVMIANAVQGYNLIWDNYEGINVASYNILRGSTPDNMQQIAQVAGSINSYTDTSAPGGVNYYSITFVKSVAAHSASNRASSEESVNSNTISTEEAIDVVAAMSIEIIVLDEDKTLSDSHKDLQLYYLLLPTYSTINKVQWEIVEGADLATIDANGKLHATGGDGQVKVRVSTIDGSALSSEIIIPTTATSTVPTGIRNITPSTTKGDEGRYYNLSGQRVEHPKKGLYIVNGRKVVIK